MLSKIAEELSQELRKRKKTLSLAESCTGGAISSALVEIQGASEVFLGSLVVYSNEWKEMFLGISTIQKYGAVSRETVEEMAAHLFQRGKSDFVAAVSGIAGPQGGTLEKPIGTVWIAIGERGRNIESGKIMAHGDRRTVIETAARTTLTGLLKHLRGEHPFS